MNSSRSELGGVQNSYTHNINHCDVGVEVGFGYVVCIRVLYSP